MLVSNKLRLTGFSGLDTESMVEQLMKAEYTKVDKMKQKLQKLKWQQEGYREMINLLRGFKDKYLDILSKDNLFSATSFQAYSTSVKLNGADTNAVKVETLAGVALGSHKITVTQLAQKERWESTKSVSGDMTGNEITSDKWAKLTKGKSFDITLDGVKKTITLSGDYGENLDNLIADLQTNINEAFGEGNVKVLKEGNSIKFEATGHTFKISDTTNTYVSSLGFNNNQTNSITGSKLTFPLENLDGTFKISVNGTEHTITLSGTYTDIGTLATDLKSKINDAFGRDVVNVTKTEDNKLKIVSYNTSEEIKLSNGDTDNILSKLGFSNGAKISKLEGAADFNISEIGKEFDIYLEDDEGNMQQIHIELTEEAKSISELAAQINSKIPGITVTTDGDKLVFSGTNGKEIRIANSTHETVEALGFKNGATNNLNLQDTLKDAFGITGTVNIEINGVSFEFKETDTVKSVMDKINNSSAGVTLSYSSVSDKFILQSDKEGAANKIRISPEDNILIEKLFGDTTGEAHIKQKAVDAKFTLDGVETTRSSNTFEVDGIKYTLNSVTNGEEVEITINSDPDQLVTKIKDFVNAYNELIGKINAKTSESRKKASTYEYYEPLTDEQKKEMSEKDIELWEEAAKTGLLRNDATLMKITESMRRALYDAVEGVGLRIFDIGITTSTAYTDKGKLVIDEEKLRKAIEENPDQVAELFTKKSSISYDSSDRATRYAENGLSSRLLDIINDNIRTTVDSKGYRGILIEKAGIENTVSNVNNMMSKEIERQNNEIEALLERLADKENRYFLMFSRMETALQSMNNQSAFLMGQLSGWQ
ncbi:MAG: flagellar filament capping protein FliD [Epulopiscium sp.]|nr:flagellar filament capping protein FliD [Candidatus Epulonipiscium sp.]